MAKHFMFLDSYTESRKKSIKAGDTSGYLTQEDFEIDDSQIIEINIPINVPEDLCVKMIDTIKTNGRHNFEAARLLYEAYKDLPLSVAASESFWAYLCHTDLYEFVQKDWSIEDKQKTADTSNYLLDHYFLGRGLMRNALAGLWWGIKLSIDESRGEDKKYDLAKILFSNYSLRIIWLKVVLRIQPALHGILEYLYDHPEILAENKKEARLRYISNYVNRLGSTKNLSGLNKEFIKGQLTNVHENIMNATIPGKGKGNKKLDTSTNTDVEELEMDDVELYDEF